MAMSIVAGITLTAGILTGINGIATIIATIIEAGAQFNFVRDGIFNGLGWSDEVYDWYAGITEGIAIVGSNIKQLNMDKNIWAKVIKKWDIQMLENQDTFQKMTKTDAI